MYEEPDKSQDTATPTVKVVAWTADSSMAIVDQRGQTCLSSAAVYANRQNNTQVSMAEPNPIGTSTGTGGSVGASNANSTTAQLIGNKDSASTFIDLALSDLCLIVLNQTHNKVKDSGFTSEQLETLIQSAYAASVEIAQAQNLVPTISSDPKITAGDPPSKIQVTSKGDTLAVSFLAPKTAGVIGYVATATNADAKSTEKPISNMGQSADEEITLKCSAKQFYNVSVAALYASGTTVNAKIGSFRDPIACTQGPLDNGLKRK
ncbi:NADPH-dependent FMN reductase family protein [Burkholderiales bacterium GJ-E10]|nr:NADPH-dependent FMN reductase family protein [Burkholderiales bacterium GJ-E10]